MRISKNLVSPSKYGIKCPYSMKPEFYVVHNTYNDAPAKNEIAYMRRNNNQTSFHYAIDDVEVIQAIPEDRNAWHAGDGGSGQGNRKGISIEICYSKSGGERFIKAEQNAAKFIAMKLKERGWGIDKVKKHQDFSKKYCPHRTLDMGWDRFLNMIKKEMGVKSQWTKPVNNHLYKVRKSWGDYKSQVGAYTVLDNAIRHCKQLTGYNVYDRLGNVVYPKKSHSESNKGPEKVWRNYINGSIVKDLQSELNKQFRAGLKVDGWFGQSTINALINVRRGARGNLTRIIQKRLIAKGYKLKHGADGSFGGGTLEAVKKFQRDHKLSADGIVGKNTWKALFRK